MKKLTGFEIKTAAVRGGRTLFIKHAIGFVFNFAGGVVLARILGPEILGVYFTSYIVFLLARCVADFGFLSMFISSESSPSAKDMRSAFSIQQVLSLLMTLVVVLLIGPLFCRWYKMEEMLVLFASAGIGAYFYSWHSIPLALLERKLDYMKVAVIEIGEILAFNITAVLLAVSGKGVLGLEAGNIMRGIIPAVLAVILSGFRPSISFKGLSGLFKKASPYFGVNAVVYIVALAPGALIGTISGLKALGLAQLTYNVLVYLMVIPTIIQRVSLAAFAKIKRDTALFNKAVERVFNFISLFFVPLMATVTAFSPLWIKAVYGNKWVGMEEVALLASIPITATSFVMVLQSSVLSIRSKSVLLQNVLFGIVYWISMYLLCGKFGSFAMPLANIIAIPVSFIVLLSVFNKEYGPLNLIRPALEFTGFFAVAAGTWYLIYKGMIFPGAVLWLLIPLYLGLNYKSMLSIVKLKGRA